MSFLELVFATSTPVDLDLRWTRIETTLVDAYCLAPFLTVVSTFEFIL